MARPKKEAPAVAPAGAIESALESSLTPTDSTGSPALKLAAAWLVAAHFVRPELAGVIAEAARLGGAR